MRKYEVVSGKAIQPTPLDEFVAGLKASLPILAAFIPFGAIYGASALQFGIPAEPALAMSSIVLAGSAQLLAVQLIGSGVPAVAVLINITIINLRHLLYGASVAPYIAHLPVGWKCLLAYLLIDEAYAVGITRFQKGQLVSSGEVRNADDSRRRPTAHWYFLGAGVTFWLAWQASTAAGIFVGTHVPASWHLDFVVPLTFIALFMPLLTRRALVFAAIVAGITAVFAHELPFRLGLIVASAFGIAAGMWVQGGKP